MDNAGSSLRLILFLFLATFLFLLLGFGPVVGMLVLDQLSTPYFVDTSDFIETLLVSPCMGCCIIKFIWWGANCGNLYVQLNCSEEDEDVEPQMNCKLQGPWHVCVFCMFMLLPL